MRSILPPYRYLPYLISACITGIAPLFSLAQITNEMADSMYIAEVQDHHEPDKVLHAEPLFIDLIRDLGARKGEREWNIGFGMTDNHTNTTATRH